MHVNSLCAFLRPEAMKGSSSFCLLILSRLLASPVWAQLTLTDPNGGALSTGSAHTPLLGSRTITIAALQLDRETFYMNFLKKTSPAMNEFLLYSTVFLWGLSLKSLPEVMEVSLTEHGHG